MKMILKFSILIFYIVSNIHSVTCFAQKTESSERLNDIHLYDYEKIFTDEEQEVLSEIIARYKDRTKKEILVVTTHSIGNFSNIQEYATNLGSIYSNEIKNENVVTMVISKKLKKIGIATSPVAREYLTDIMANNIINEVIVPRVKEGYLFDGVKKGVCDVIKILSEE